MKKTKKIWNIDIDPLELIGIYREDTAIEDEWDNVSRRDYKPNSRNFKRVAKMMEILSEQAND